MKYSFNKGNNNHVIIALHGSRTKLEKIVERARMVDPEAKIIGVQGEIKENGATRYFFRHESEEVNAKSLKDSTLEFYNLIHEAIETHGLENHLITLLGYSNGANLIENLLKVYQDVPVEQVILLHPASITPDKKFKNQKVLKVLLTSGKEDNFLPKEKLIKIENNLLDANIKYELFVHNGGHEMIDEELFLARKLFSK